MDSPVDTRMNIGPSLRYVEHAPIGIIVVNGPMHTIVYANAAFRQSSGSDGNAIVGRSIRDVLTSASADMSVNPPAAELVTLLDSVRADQLRAGDVNTGASATANIGADDAICGSWTCMVWHVQTREGELDELVVQLVRARDSDPALARQREIAERMLVSALREQALSEDNVRLYAAARDARDAAEEAQSRAEVAQHEAEAANAAKAQFLANMSHELRTPLNAISGYAQLIEMGLRGPVTEAQLLDLRRIQRSQKHLLGLINAVLNYAKLEAGSVVYALQTVVLDDVVIDAQALVDPQLHAKALSYHFTRVIGFAGSPESAPVHVTADPEKLRQILLNLLTNAMKFTARGGEIIVTRRTDGEMAVLSVRDTGLGIPAHKLQTIFDPFVQIGRGLTSGEAGVGLGLAISRDLALGMQGDLTVESVEGEGSIFTLTLPLASSDLSAEAV